MADTTARGYGWRHQKLRARLAPVVAAGGVMCAAPVCLMPSREIIPGTPWDLGHSDHDRSVYTGPEHRRCNRAIVARRRARRRSSRSW
jgi:hypothetical protein